MRDLPFVVSQGTHGATTVAATMRLAALAGISVFVTGGLGGVHTLSYCNPQMRGQILVA